MAQFSLHPRRRLLILVLVAAGVVGSLAFYRTRQPTGLASGLAWFQTSSLPTAAKQPLNDKEIAPLLAYNKALETVAMHARDAVVQISVTASAKPGEGQTPMDQFFGQFFGQRPRQQKPRIEHGIGSGVIISPNGYIVTNNHVVEGATTLNVTLSDGRFFSGKVVGTDPLTDLAVVKIDASNLNDLPWGDSRTLHPGEVVLAVGSPFGQFRFSVTSGIVSGLGRPRLDNRDARALGDFIQTDAAINPGNSGGPLVDVRGQIIGINSAIFTPSGAFAGVGFAIPSQIVQRVAQDLIKFGKVNHGYLGIWIEDIKPTELQFFHLTRAQGALISEVSAGSPGAKAGLKVGDVVTSINGEPVKDAGELQVATSLSPPGTKLTLQVMREGKPVTLHATLGSMPPQQQQRAQAAAQQPSGGFHLGVTAEDLTPAIRDQLNLPSTVQGPVIHGVQPGSPADNSGLAPGMVIEDVNRQPVHSASELQAALQKATPGSDILLRVWFNGGSLFLVVHPNAPVH